jgi:hypothetical protein
MQIDGRYSLIVNYQPLKRLAFTPGWKFTIGQLYAESKIRQTHFENSKWSMPEYRSWMASIFFEYIRAACNGISR